MLREPCSDIALAPAQQPGARDMQPRRYRRWIATKVLFDGCRATPKQRSEFVEVKQFQGWSQANGFSGHERAFGAGTCRYAPRGVITARLA